MSVSLYRVYEDDELLYVGCSMYGAQRLQQHASKPWWPRATRVTLEHFETRDEALKAESRAILGESPEFNLTADRRAGRPSNKDTFWWFGTCSNCDRRAGFDVPKGTLIVDIPRSDCERCGCAGTVVPDQRNAA